MNKLVVILGPTATGKTNIAVKTARVFNGEIISADSRQVYRGMNLGTGKDLFEYNDSEGEIPYSLIDIIDPEDEFNLYYFLESFSRAFNDITSRGKLPVLCGGTGLYLNAVLQKYTLKKVNEADAEKEQLEKMTLEELLEVVKERNLHQQNTNNLFDRERLIKSILINNSEQKAIELPEYDPLVIGITLPREEIKKKITARLKKRLEEGMVEEIATLMKNGVTYERLLSFGLEYKFIAMHVKGELTFNDMQQKLNSAIHAFAKRQMTWFRKMERDGVKINWINAGDFEAAKKLTEKFL